MEEKKAKIVGWKDYFDVEGVYGEYQCKKRYIVESEFNDTEASCHSIEEGVTWIEELISEYKRDFDMAFVEGTVQHIRVPLIEDNDGDVEEDWCGNIQYLESKEVNWYDDDDDDE